MATRNLLVRAGFDASHMIKGTKSATRSLNSFSKSASMSMGKLNATMSGAFGGMGKLMAGAFAIGAIVNFGRECVDLGSNLTEVQNVVDVTFGSMAESVNEFAKTSITSFGMSETAAKKYTGTMGAMLKSSGLTVAQSAEMSMALTKLGGDFASFYNITSEDAFTKIRAGMAGEVMPLRQLGIDMTVASLEAYALSQGMTKAYQAMSRSEQMMLRYNYLLSVSADAQGDFVRTSDSWANQTRVLSEQWNSLKATLGQGFINLLTPVVKVLNDIILRLQTAAAYFKAFTEVVFGKQASGAGQVAKDINGVTAGADDATGAIDGMGEATEDAAKKAKGALAGFDEVNQLNISADSGSGAGTAGTTPIPALDLALGNELGDMDKLSVALEKAKSEASKLADIFKAGFVVGFGGFENIDFSGIKTSLESIKKSLKTIFTDKDLIDSASNFLKSWIYCAGQVTGAIASVGKTVAELFLGGISKYLEQNTAYLTESLIKIFDIGTAINGKIGLIFTDLADIFSVFGSDSAQQLLANVLDGFSTIGIELFILAQKIGLDFLTGISNGIAVNMAATKEAISNSLNILETLSGTVKSFIEDSFSSLQSSYDKYISPAIQNFIGGFTSMQTAVLDFYNTHLAPTLKNIANKFDVLYKEAIKPFVDSFMTTFGKLWEYLSVWFKKCIAEPFNLMLKLFGPTISLALDGLYDAFDVTFRLIGGVITGLMTALGGILDFIIGVFTGDWERAWDGVSLVFKGVWDSLVAIAKAPLNLIINMVNSVIRAINKISFKVPDSISKVPGMGWAEGLGWEGINIGEIPKLAKGGIVDSSTIAEIGEAGKEAVVPLENNTGWMDEFAIKLANAMGTSQGNTSNSSRQTVSLEIDGRTFAEMIVSYMPEASRRMGVSLNG